LLGTSHDELDCGCPTSLRAWTSLKLYHSPKFYCAWIVSFSFDCRSLSREVWIWPIQKCNTKCWSSDMGQALKKWITNHLNHVWTW
jgi:hypothetical protein